MQRKTKEIRRRVCVFCASSPGVHPEYRAEAVALGRLLGNAGLGLVYGGAQVGLMGMLADAALAQGGEVIGVIPRALAGVEVAHQGLSRLVLVETMHERKALMVDEFFEVLTWAQLGIHTKPCLLVNTGGYYDQLLSFLEVAINQGFLKPENRAFINVVGNAAEALQCMQQLWRTLPVSHTAPATPAP